MNKHTSKLLALVLAVSMIGSALLTGCGAGNTSAATSSTEPASSAGTVSSGEVAEGQEISDKPVIGISWAYNTRDEDVESEYASYTAVIEAAGGTAVELPQITISDVEYDDNGVLLDSYVEESGMLKQEYADMVKSCNFDHSNVAEALEDVDGVFFIGGEDISPSLYATPMEVDNEGEGINATRDISDYTLMAYCIDQDIPTLAACRGEQMMGIVSGCTFVQDIPNYYKSLNATYDDTHRMPPDAPDRDYARHDIELVQGASKWMEDIVGAATLDNVSSWHHQCIQSVEGTDLTVVAKKTVDGVDIIEGIERQDKTFCLGVQFHPENDVGLAVYDKTPEKALCDVDTCLRFFETLVEYAAADNTQTEKAAA